MRLERLSLLREFHALCGRPVWEDAPLTKVALSAVCTTSAHSAYCGQGCFTGGSFLLVYFNHQVAYVSCGIMQ